MAPRAQQVAVVCCVVALGAAWLTRSPAVPRPQPFAATVLRRWRPRAGDVVFRASGDVIGDAIRARPGAAGRFSHVGVVVDLTGTPMILDVSPFGTGHVKLLTIAEFVAGPTTSRVEIMRPKLPLDIVALNAEATAIVQHHVPFDYAFDTEDDRALYCSELVFKILHKAGVRWTDVRTQRMTILLSGDRDVITPDALARSVDLAPLPLEEALVDRWRLENRGA